MAVDLSPVWISLKTAVTSTIITFFIGIAASWLVADYRGRFKGLIDGLFTLPLVLPPTVVGFILLLIFGKNGPIGKLLFALGTSVIFSWPATVIAAVVVSFPLMYKTARGAFEQIDANILDAARTLGVSEWRVFWEISVPLAWPGIVAGIVLAFARALGEFGATLMIAGSIPGKTQTLPIAIYFAVENGEMGTALVWVIIIFIISLTSMVLVNCWNDRRLRVLRPSGRKTYGA